eukprot:scaffold98265_cov48-Prasinocladus_malaysianus.AAC.2
MAMTSSVCYLNFLIGSVSFLPFCRKLNTLACYNVGIGITTAFFTWFHHRDSVMGGNPFMDPRHQGLVCGLATDPRTDVDQGSCLDQLERLLEYCDWLRLSLAG